MSASGTDELMFPQQLVAEDSPIGFALLLTPWHGQQGGCTQGGGWLCFQKFPLHFACVTWKSSQLALISRRWCPLLQDVLSVGSRAWLVRLRMAFMPRLPESRPPTLVPILHTARVMREKQITAVTYFQPPSSRKLSHQKLSMSPVQPQKSKQSRSVKCQIAGRLLWTSASGRQDSSFTDYLRKSCMKKRLLLLQADPVDTKSAFPSESLMLDWDLTRQKLQQSRSFQNCSKPGQN